MFINGLNLGNIGIQGTDAAQGSETSLSILSRSYQSARVRQAGALRTVQGQVRDLQDELEAFERLSRTARLIRSGSEAKPAQVVGSPLGLSTVDSYSTLTSTDEINTDSTAFTPTAPSWLGTGTSGTSTSSITVSGTYTGTTTDTLTFEATRRAQIGSGRPELNIYDSTGNLLDTLSWASGDPAGTEVTSTVTGLTVALGSGVVRKADTFEVDVFAGDQVAPDPTELLAEATSYEDGTQFFSGSFTVNGVEIAVDVDTDSLQDVLDAISASGAGVTATLSGEQVVLTANDPGSDPITVGNDTTGLLSALKLEDAVSTTGTLDETDAIMDTVSALGGISAGSFTLNGTLIAIDPGTDSVQDVIDTINSAGAGVVATLTNGAITITGVGGGNISLSGDTSGFLARAGIAEGLVEGQQGSSSLRGSRQAARTLSKAFVDLAEALNEVFEANPELDASIRLDRIEIQSKIRASITGALSERDMAVDDNALDLEFNLDDEASPVLSLRRVDQKRLERAMIENPREIDRLLFGSNQRQGLIASMTEATGAALESLQESLRDLGPTLNVYA